MNLLKEVSRGDQQQDLKTADGSTAGANDTLGKSPDVKFSLMRNMINKDGAVTGSNVNDFLERSHELNDEVDSVGFAVETSDGELIKIYVNAIQADDFEQELSKMLGLDDDSESAVNTLAQKFDIVDVVWPDGPEDGASAGVDPYATDTVDDSPLSFDDEDGEHSDDTEEHDEEDAKELDGDVLDDEGDPEELPDLLDADEDDLDDDEPLDGKSKDKDDSDSDELDNELENDEDDKLEADEDDELADDELEADEDEVVDGGEKKPKAKKSLMKDIANDEAEIKDDEAEIKDDETDELDDSEDDELGLELDDTEDALDDEPVKKKKKVKSAPKVTGTEIKTEEGLKFKGRILEGVQADIEQHVKNTKQGTKKWYIEGLVTGGTRGRLQYSVKKSGTVQHFSSEALAEEEAVRLTKLRNVAGAKAHFSFTPKSVKNAVTNEVHEKTKNYSPINKALPMHARNKMLNRTSAYEEFSSTERVSDSPIGAGFLSRLSEAEPVMKLDASWHGIYSHLKRQYEKKIVQFFFAVGIPGRIAVREDGLLDGIIAGCNVLRHSGRKQELFNKLYDFFTADAEAPIQEAKKRGPRQQKIFESVLVELGLPVVMTTTAGSGQLSSVFSRAATKISSNVEMEGVLLAFAKSLGISGAELNEEDDKIKYSIRKSAHLLDEDTEGNAQDVYIQLVIDLCIAMGVPKQNMQHQKSALARSLLARKATFINRPMIEQRVGALALLIEKGIKPVVTSMTESRLTEAFAPLEAMTKSDLDKIQMQEPAAGPGMMASYEGSGKHEETILTVAVDFEAEDDNKSLRVGIDGPWDGTSHFKFFANTKAGYKDAVDYANMLRTANLKSGGRPKGWKEMQIDNS